MGRQRKDDETQGAEPRRAKLKPSWELMVAVVVALIVGEVAFQWAKHRGWTTYRGGDGPPGRQVYSIAAAPDGAVWFGTLDGVSRFDGQTWTNYTTDDGLASDHVRSIAVSHDGVVWVGTWDWRDDYGGVSRFDGEGWSTYTAADGLADNPVAGVTVAPDGVMWCGSADGLSRFDGQTWTNYTTDDGLVDDSVSFIVVDFFFSIAVDSHGVLWVGTSRGIGVSRFDGDTWTTYTENDGLAHFSVTSIAVARDGTLWAGTRYGISRFEGKTWTTYTTDDGLAGDWVTSIAQAPDGVLWFGTSDGLSRFDGQSWTTYTTSNSGLADDHIEALALDDQGRVWMGTDDGLSVFDERVGLPGQLLQVWAQIWVVLRIVGIAVSALLAIVGFVRRLRALPAERKAPLKRGRLVLGTYVYAGLVVGVGVSAIVGGSVSALLDTRWDATTVELWVDGAGLGLIIGGFVGLILAAIGWMIGAATGKGHVKGFPVRWWAMINAVLCGAVTWLICLIIFTLSFPVWT